MRSNINMTDVVKGPDGQLRCLACPECGRKINKKSNYLETKGWTCYVCQSKFDTPAQRRLNYFEDEVGKKKKRIKDPDGEVRYEDIPIKRWHKKKFRADDSTATRIEFLRLISKKFLNRPHGKHDLTRREIRNLAFVSYIFLTGSRVQEVVGMPMRDGENNTTGLSIPGKWFVEPVRKNQIISEISVKQGKEFLFWKVKNLPVLKHRVAVYNDETALVVKRDVPRRTVSLLYSEEKELIEHVNNWLVHVKGDDEIIFKLSAQQAWRIAYQFTGKYNHWLRHIRATDLTVNFNFSDRQLMHFFGWASPKQADTYAHLKITDLENQFIRGVRDRPKVISHEEAMSKTDLEIEEKDEDDDEIYV